MFCFGGTVDRQPRSGEGPEYERQDQQNNTILTTLDEVELGARLIKRGGYLAFQQRAPQLLPQYSSAQAEEGAIGKHFSKN